MVLRRCWAYFENLGANIADKVTGAVGTWRFVFIYTVSMIIWIWLHLIEVLHIDSSEFIRFNLWLSYFAGIQASIVLMSTNRQVDLDRRRHDDAFEIDRESYFLAKDHHQKIVSLLHQVAELEQVIEELLLEKEKES